MTKGHVCWRALLAAFPYTTPILAGFAFLGFAYGVYMNVMGFPFYYPFLLALVIFGGSLEFVAVSLLLAPFAPHAGLDGGRHSPLYAARPTRVCLSMWKRPAKQAGRAKCNAQTKGPSWQWEGPLRVCRCWLCR